MDWDAKLASLAKKVPYTVSNVAPVGNLRRLGAVNGAVAPVVLSEPRVEKDGSITFADDPVAVAIWNASGPQSRRVSTRWWARSQ